MLICTIIFLGFFFSLDWFLRYALKKVVLLPRVDGESDRHLLRAFLGYTPQTPAGRMDQLLASRCSRLHSGAAHLQVQDPSCFRMAKTHLWMSFSFMDYDLFQTPLLAQGLPPYFEPSGLNFAFFLMSPERNLFISVFLCHTITMYFDGTGQVLSRNTKQSARYQTYLKMRGAFAFNLCANAFRKLADLS